MRLVNVDNVISDMEIGKFRSPDEVCFSENDVANMLSKAPTAFDFDGVTQRLSDEKESWKDYNNERIGRAKSESYASAIHIVKCGLVDIDRVHKNDRGHYTRDLSVEKRVQVVEDFMRDIIQKQESNMKIADKLGRDDDYLKAHDIKSVCEEVISILNGSMDITDSCDDLKEDKDEDTETIRQSGC